MARLSATDIALNSRGEWCVAVEVSRDYSTTGLVRKLVPIGCPNEFTRYEALAAAAKKKDEADG